jgi:hypothetical protein
MHHDGKGATVLLLVVHHLIFDANKRSCCAISPGLRRARGGTARAWL